MSVHVGTDVSDLYAFMSVAKFSMSVPIDYRIGLHVGRSLTDL
jgi:hypothetical protein